MPRPIDSIDPATREKIKSLDERMRLLSLVVAKEATTGFNAVGGVRSGAPSERGTATDRWPELFIQVDIPNAKVKWFLTIPTDTSGGSYDWVELGKFTLT